MGILDFFRKLKKEEQKKELEKEKINFSDIPSFINKKESELKEKEKEVLNELSQRIALFSNEIPQKIINLENFDVNSKKDEDRLKSTVIRGRKEYISSLNNFLENLKNLKKENLKQFNLEVDKLFLNFNKSTYKNYERTTILIGKEMAEIKNEIKSLSNDLLKIIQENKEIPDSLKKLSIIKSNLENLKNFEESIKNLKNEIINIEKEKLRDIDENKRIISEIEKIKQSEEYKKYLEKKEKINSLENKIKQEMNHLKQKIDFKSLASFFHVFEDKMKILKDHKENFIDRFEQDQGKDLLILLEESKLNEESILNKIEEIKEKKEEINSLFSELNENNLEELLKKKEKIALEIVHLDTEKFKKEKKLDGIEDLKELLKNKIKKEMIEFDLELE